MDPKLNFSAFSFSWAFIVALRICKAVVRIFLLFAEQSERTNGCLSGISLGYV